jgi:hypothetical protein
LVGVVVTLGIIAGIYRHRQIAPEVGAIARSESDAAPAGDLAPVLAEAKRDIG